MDEVTVYQYLDRIVAQPICSMGRASNMLWLGIGDKIKALTRLGKEVEISTYTLHIQSTWRIISKEEKEILFASSDFYSPRKDIDCRTDFNWEPQGNNLFDQKSQRWLKKDIPIYIKEYKINRWGDLLLIFSNNDRLEVFVTSSDDTECWRMLTAEEQELHLVVTGLGTSFE